MGSGVADENHAGMAQTYARRAVEMKAQAQRAETVHLQAIYSSIADNWDRLAAEMQAAERARPTSSGEEIQGPEYPTPPNSE